MSAYDDLPPWQQRFVDAYVSTAADASAAFRIVKPAAKRPDVGASELMAKPLVAAAIAERTAERRELSEINEAWVLERLRRVVDHCMDTKGGSRRMDTAGANRSLELIGRHFAMFTDRVEGAGGPVVVNIIKFSQERRA
jgi:hypothetical protein